MTSVKWESGGDYTLTAIAKPAENYSFLGWYEAIVDAEGNITGYTGDPISLEKTITLEKESSKKELYALFKQVIKEVSITIDAPIAGDTVTIDWVDPDDHSKGYNFYTQNPVPNISVTGNCSVSLINGEGIPVDRKIAFWMKNKLEIFIGDFVNGEKYYVVSKLVADQGYEFFSGDLKPTVTVNGTKISDFTVTNNEEGSFLEFYALLEAYDPDDYKFVCTDDGGGVWEKGSSATLSFTFDRKKGGAKKEDLQGIYMDGKEVVKDDKNYLVKDGSVIVELLPAYLETLSAGEHTMTAVFVDKMTATVKFNVQGKKEAPQDKKVTPVKTYSIPVTGVD